MDKLTDIQKKVLELFRKSSLKDKFYWTGGTVLSFFYLHHRRSNDLDFFSDKSFNYSQIIGFIRNLKEKLRLRQIEQKKIFDRWEFFLKNEEEIRIEFVFYDYPKIRARKKWQGIFIDSLDDIAANKTMALFDRNDPKDLVDLYFLLTKKRYNVKTLLRLVERKFGIKLEESSFWSESLKALDNLNKISPLLIAKNSKEKQKIMREIKKFFISNSIKYLEKWLK